MKKIILGILLIPAIAFAEHPAGIFAHEYNARQGSQGYQLQSQQLQQQQRMYDQLIIQREIENSQQNLKYYENKMHSWNKLPEQQIQPQVQAPANNRIKADCINFGSIISCY